MNQQFLQSAIDLAQEFLAVQKAIFAISDEKLEVFSENLQSYFEYLLGTGQDLEHVNVSEDSIYGFETYLRKHNRAEAALLMSVYCVMMFGLFLHRKQRDAERIVAIPYRMRERGRSRR